MRTVSDRVVSVVFAFDNNVLRLICGYALQRGRGFENNHCFIGEFKRELDMYRADDYLCTLVMLIDMWVGMSMDLIGFMGRMVHIR